MFNCPVCKTESGKYHIQVDRFNIYFCNNCGLQYTYPLPSSQELTEFYSTYQEQYYDLTAKRLISLEYVDFMTKNGIDRQAKLLDYGCGEDDFVKVWGNGAIGYDYYKPNTYLGEGYDIITMFGVIEHLTDPIGLTRELVNDLLYRDGYIVLKVIVNDSGIPYRYKPPEHLTYWTRQSIELLYEKCGLEMVAYEPCDMYERLSIIKEKMGRKLSPLVREKVMPANDGDDFEYVLVATNNILTIGKKQ